MDKIIHMVIFGTLAVAVLPQVTIAQTVHMVGDNFGWTIPINGAAAYSKWGEANTIKVGDTLVFNFMEGNHNVQEVSRSSYEECSTRNAIGEAITKGPAKITIKTPGDHFYICTIGQHCLAGQKMAIKVLPTNAAKSPAESTLPPPSSSILLFPTFLLTLSSIALTIFL